MRYLIAPPRVLTLLAHSAPTDPVMRLMVPGLSHLDVLTIAMLIDTNHSLFSRLYISNMALRSAL
jgi:hypothetical protein